MKKVLLGFMMSFMLVSNSFAIETEYGYLVSGFLSTTVWGAPKPLLQDNTGYENACGPTSLLFVYNHFYKLNNGENHSLFSDSTKSSNVLRWVYNEMSIFDNKVTEFKDLKSFMRYSLKWDGVRRMSESDGIDNNLSYLKDFLSDDIPALVVLDSNFSRNPTKGKHNIDHIVIVFAYINDDQNTENDRIYFFDPYFGGISYFTVAEIPNMINLTGFAFLALSPENKGTY